MKAALCIMIAALAVSAATADNILDEFVDFVGEALQSSDGAALLLAHGRDASGAGPGLQWQVEGLPLYIDLGVVTSNRGQTRVMPGLSVRPSLVSRTGIDVCFGVAWTPSEYGMARIGGFKTYAAPYIKLARGLR